jgi:hypothetical protein
MHWSRYFSAGPRHLCMPHGLVSQGLRNEPGNFPNPTMFPQKLAFLAWRHVAHMPLYEPAAQSVPRRAGWPLSRHAYLGRGLFLLLPSVDLMNAACGPRVCLGPGPAPGERRLCMRARHCLVLACYTVDKSLVWHGVCVVGGDPGASGSRVSRDLHSVPRLHPRGPPHALQRRPTLWNQKESSMAVSKTMHCPEPWN